MDQQGHGRMMGGGGGGGGGPPSPYAVNPYKMPGPSAPGPGPGPGQVAQHQLAYQHIAQQQQEQLQQQLRGFWAGQQREVEGAGDFKNHSLPLARIKKIMKADEDVRMISAEAPVVFARACEMFVLELTLRSWSHTEENKRRTLQKNDIAAAITRTDIFDFLVDIVPREDLKDEGIPIPGPPAGGVTVQRGPAEGVPSYYYIGGQGQGMMVGKPAGDPGMYGQQGRPYMPPWPPGDS